MFSMPPAMTTCDSPSRILSAPSMIALRPLPQTLLMVRACAASEIPALRIACRAGAAGEALTDDHLVDGSGGDPALLQQAAHHRGDQIRSRNFSLHASER